MNGKVCSCTCESQHCSHFLEGFDYILFVTLPVLVEVNALHVLIQLLHL